MEIDKHEYLLHTWGGFYNEQFKKIHGLSEGYFYFDKLEDLHLCLKKLRKIEEDLNAKYLMSTIYHGTHVRYKTIAKMDFIYKNKLYKYEEDFGYAYPENTVLYMFETGNYSCDCNRSLFLNKKYENFPILDCGQEIEMLNLEIVKRK